ncbi:hypothetical protein GCM10027347_18040 [Larkinella harenae]
MKHYLLVAGLLLPLISQAQATTQPDLAQGQVQVGLGVGAGWGNSVGGYLRATPYAQYFLKEGWALRLEGRYNYNGSDGDNYLGAGLMTQYHFLRTNRFSLYGQAGYFYGRTNYGLYRFVEESPTISRLERYRAELNYGMVNVGLGGQYQLSRRWSINALAEKHFGQQVNRFPADGYSVNLGVGFRIK